MGLFKIWVEELDSVEAQKTQTDAINFARMTMSNPVSLNSKKIITVVMKLVEAYQKLIDLGSQYRAYFIVDYLNTRLPLRVYAQIMKERNNDLIPFLIPPRNVSTDEAKRNLQIMDFAIWGDKKDPERLWISEEAKRRVRGIYLPPEEDDAEYSTPPVIIRPIDLEEPEIEGFKPSEKT